MLTGNTRAVARIKLDTFNLSAHLDLDIGAYGDDQSHRPSLVPIAQARAAAHHHHAFDRGNTILIGDSPNDIDTASQGGATIIAVAAGGTPALQLNRADAVLDDLTNIAAIATMIEQLAHTH